MLQSQSVQDLKYPKKLFQSIFAVERTLGTCAPMLKAGQLITVRLFSISISDLADPTDGKASDKQCQH